ncbi:hypothetical protein QBC38DRAFT_352915 [Podospora fimiseda]|uniref:CFEM domain-containing protein n=1 Tax=Podospora fimiseda TaxID=252190 RepID=A0AAN7BZA5_9PEZI|nr:hypothetical protein QBC38DRAFT_352915 [Podospora fimiseda]
MKVLIPFAALFLGLSHSQDLSGQPACATNCIISAVSAAGCAPSDISCQCGTTKDIIAASAAPCLLASCAATELLQAQSAGNAQCSRFAATASGLRLLNEATTAKVTTTATSTHTSTSTSYTTYKPAVSAGPAASLKVGLSGLLGVAGVIFAGL